MSKRSYSSVVIPSTLYDRIQKHVKNSGGRYVSISEVVREAVWKFLRD